MSNTFTDKTIAIAILPLLSCAGILAMPTVAAAYIPEKPVKDDTLYEIIVTATRRPENLQNVPMSISAFSAAHLEAYHAPALEDLSDHVANMWMPASTEAGQSFITMRGINAGITRSSGRSVGVYVDGVYVSADTAMNIAMFDVDHIEVLKGPQGTLFGRDTIGGAINITTKKPASLPEGKVQVETGSYGLRQILASASTPVVKDVLFLRLAAIKSNKGGYIKNAFTGRKAGAEDHLFYNAQLYYTPNSRLDARLVFSAQKIDDRPNALGEATTNIGSDTIPYTINLDQDEFQKQTVRRASLNANYEFANGHTLSWTSGWSQVDDFYIQDGDRLPQSITVAQFDGGARELSQEVRLTSPQYKRLDYLFGLYFLDARRDFNPTFPVMGSAFLEQVLGIPPQFHPADTLDGQQVRTKTTSKAAFAHANFHLSDQLTAYGGLRFTNDHKRVDYRSFGEVFGVFGLPPLQATSQVRHHPLSWMGGLRYQLTDTVMAYGSISRGYRSAAIKDNFVSAADINAPSGFFTRPEFLTNYETGLKTSLFGNRLRVNAAAFTMQYTDIQVSISQEPFLFLRSLTNAARAHINGFETDLAARLTSRLKITAAAGYVHSRYDDFTPRPGVDLAGTSFGTAPVWTFSAAADYRLPLANGSALSAHLDYANRTAPKTTPPGELAFVGDYGVVNGALDYEAPNGRWRAKLWVKNLGNVNLPMVNKLWGSGLGPLIENETVRYEPPRRFGVSFTLNFSR